VASFQLQRIRLDNSRLRISRYSGELLKRESEFFENLKLLKDFPSVQHCRRTPKRNPQPGTQTRNGRRPAYAPAGCASAGGSETSRGFSFICNARPAAIMAINPPAKKAN